MGSSKDGSDHMEIDEFIFKEFINSSNLDIDGDEDEDFMVMMSILEEMEKRNMWINEHQPIGYFLLFGPPSPPNNGLQAPPLRERGRKEGS